MTKANLTPDQIDWHEYFIYSEDGSLVWKTRPKHHFKTEKGCNIFNSKFAGKRAGVIGKNGRVRTRISQFTAFLVHRIIYEMFNGKILDNTLNIDHIDGDPQNNKIENLRLVTMQQNQFNTKTDRGCYFHPEKRKWEAYIRVSGARKCLGYFNSEKEARFEYLKNKLKLHEGFVPVEMIAEFENLCS